MMNLQTDIGTAASTPLFVSPDATRKGRAEVRETASVRGGVRQARGMLCGWSS
jgi:hypothetical protein